MEIVLTSTSPLGQYLAELEANGEDTRAHLLSVHRPTVAQKRSRRRFGYVVRYRSLLRLIRGLQHRIGWVAMQRLLPALCVFHPTIREELQQVTSNATVYAAPSRARSCWWIRYIAVIEVLSGRGRVSTVSTRVAGVVMAANAILSSLNEDTKIPILQVMKGVVAAIVIIFFGLEISVRLLFALYARRSRRLVGSLNELGAALKQFNEIYTESLAIVKRAELASQGYQLGAGMLPPIGRLEANIAMNCIDDENADLSVFKTQLRCIPLRRMLRIMNDRLLERASAFTQEGGGAAAKRSRDAIEEGDTIDDRAPSLLLTALVKQRNRGILLLENAVRTTLVRTLARACSRNSSNRFSLFDSLVTQRQAVEHLIQDLSIWTGDLEAWNTTKDPVDIFTSNVELESSKQQKQHQQDTLSSMKDMNSNSIAMQLREIRSLSETLTALSIAAQYELLSGDPVEERLCNSQKRMRLLILYLQEEWTKFDGALNALKHDGTPQDTSVDNERKREAHCDSQTTEVTTSSSVRPIEDPNCTLVFTGTSTGDDNFDLPSMLKLQEAEDSTVASVPTLHLVRELRGVLAHRVAHAQTGLTKQIDHDSPKLSTPVVLPLSPLSKSEFSLPPAPSSNKSSRLVASTTASLSNEPNRISDAIGNTFNLELQALLQRARLSQPK